VVALRIAMMIRVREDTTTERNAGRRNQFAGEDFIPERQKVPSPNKTCHRSNFDASFHRATYRGGS
jgi:hypothetical protein